jgi:hypothetical protein
MRITFTVVFGIEANVSLPTPRPLKPKSSDFGNSLAITTLSFDPASPDYRTAFSVFSIQ